MVGSLEVGRTEARCTSDDNFIALHHYEKAHGFFRPEGTARFEARWINQGMSFPKGASRMVTLVEPTNVQKIEFNVTTTEGPSCVTIVTGTMPISLAAFGKPGTTTQRGSFKAVLDPALTPGQFRRATSTVSFGAIMSSASLTASGGAKFTEQWVLDNAQATFDHKAGRVQLVVDVTVRATGPGTSTQTTSLMFQVTTLAKN